MMIRRFLQILCMAFLAAAMPLPAWACACCADPGDRLTGTQPLEGYLLGLLRDLRFGPKAAVHMTSCGAECVRGIADVTDTYDLSVVPSAEPGQTWTLSLTDPATNAAGTLRFSMPDTAAGTSLDPDPDAGELTTILYKEIRIDTLIRGEGIFQTGIAQMALILHGRGNHCDDRSDFTHWTLDATGPSAEFRLFGRLLP